MQYSKASLNFRDLVSKHTQATGEVLDERLALEINRQMGKAGYQHYLIHVWSIKHHF